MLRYYWVLVFVFPIRPKFMWFFLFDYKTKLFLGFKSNDHGYLGPAGSQALTTQCRVRLSSWPQAPCLIFLPFPWKDSRGPAVKNSGSVPRLLCPHLSTAVCHLYDFGCVIEPLCTCLSSPVKYR